VGGAAWKRTFGANDDPVRANQARPDRRILQLACLSSSRRFACRLRASALRRSARSEWCSPVRLPLASARQAFGLVKPAIDAADHVLAGWDPLWEERPQERIPVDPPRRCSLPGACATVRARAAAPPPRCPAPVLGAREPVRPERVRAGAAARARGGGLAPAGRTAPSRARSRRRARAPATRHPVCRPAIRHQRRRARKRAPTLGANELGRSACSLRRSRSRSHPPLLSSLRSAGLAQEHRQPGGANATALSPLPA